MGKYDVDMKRLAVLLLPTALRQPRLSALVQVLMAPLSRLHSEFTGYREMKTYRLTHNGQVCYLRAVLNDRYDSALRRITIEEPEQVPSTCMLYLRQTGRFTRITHRGAERQVTLRRRGYGGIGGLDFWICVPLELMTDDTYSENALRALANQYKLASKRFGIKYN